MRTAGVHYFNEPGIYYDMADADYRRDPCPTPSLTQSIAKILIERSPLHAWHAHPRLNPNFEPDNDTKYDIGNIAHRIMLGRGKELVALPFDNWLTKAAKEARAAAAMVGKLAVLEKHIDRAAVMVRVARDALHDVCFDAFENGKGEVVIAWREPLGFWCRSMIDWVARSGNIYDYKTTGMSAAPHVVGRMMVDMGWDIQAAMIERGWRTLQPDKPSPRFRFVVQEDDPPFAVTVCELSESVLTMGRKKIARAMAIWGHCIANNNWPGYPIDIVRPEYPGWAESQWLEREVKDAARERMPKTFDPNILMAG